MATEPRGNGLHRTRVGISTILLFSLLASCYFQGPVDNGALQKVAHRPPDSLFFGTWELDSFSLRLIDAHYHSDSLRTVLHIDKAGHFVFDQAPDFLLSPTGQPIRGVLETLQGKWNIERFQNTWGTYLSCEPSTIIPHGGGLEVRLYVLDKEPVLLLFVGDPDSGNRLLLQKHTLSHAPLDQGQSAQKPEESFAPLKYNETYPFNLSTRIELVSYPVRYSWDTIRKGDNTYLNDVLIKKGRMTIPRSRIKDRAILNRAQQNRLFSILCNEPCPEEDKMVAACYDPRHALFFYDERGAAIAYVELCLECYQSRSTKGIPVQDFCSSKITALHQLFVDCGVTYFGGPEDWQ